FRQLGDGARGSASRRRARCAQRRLDRSEESSALTLRETSMLRVYGDIQSGNCYKIKLLASHLAIAHEWIHVDILKNESRTPEFLARNPTGKIPTVVLDDGRTLAESNAILNSLAHGSAYLPADRWQLAKVLEWQFFEQYSHEPYIATARYIAKYL